MKKAMGLCVVLAIGVVLFVGCASSDTSSPESIPSATEMLSDSQSGTMTKAAFDQIQDGMTYEQVTKIIGSPGELQSESGTKGADGYTAAYGYKGQGELGANAMLMFQGGKLISKTQMGLK